MGTRRKYTREFKVEAVKLVRNRGVTMAQAARDLGAPKYTACTQLRLRD